MRRPLFTLASALSLVACPFCILEAINIATDTGGQMHWDMQAQQWLPYPLKTPHLSLLRIAGVSLLAAAPLVWLPQIPRRPTRPQPHLARPMPRLPLRRPRHYRRLPRMRHPLHPRAHRNNLFYAVLVLLLLIIWPPVI